LFDFDFMESRPALQRYCESASTNEEFRITMASQTRPVTRIACFRFRENVTAEQKGDRTRAFLNLYKRNEDLLLGMPKGGKPLNTPLNLTNVKRDSVWDTGFIVTFKVSLLFDYRLEQD
jgi:hypothetical protein